MAHLKYLLSTKEGRAYVALCLVDALHEHEEIRPGLPREPYPHMTLDEVAQRQTEDLARRAHLVLHVNKSRDTDQGWVVVEEFPSEFIKSLPPLIQVEERELASKLQELARLRAREAPTLDCDHCQDVIDPDDDMVCTECYERLAKQLRESPTPEAVKWWRNFCEETRQNVYASMGCTEDTQPVNTAKNSARTILQWAARSKMPKSWDIHIKTEEIAELKRKVKLRDEMVEGQLKEAQRWKERCTFLEEENAKRSPSLDTSKCFRCGTWENGKMSCPACTEKLTAKNIEAHTKGLRQAVDDLREEVQGKREELEVAFKHIGKLEQLLGQAVVDLNKTGKPDSPWVQKYKRLHEEYLHQTPTGKAVDHNNEVIRLQGLNKKLRQEIVDLTEKVEMARKEESSAIDMYDKLAEEIIDLLVPDFYDVDCKAARAGADITQITDAIQNLVYLARKKEGDFESQLHKLFEEGRSDAAVAEYYDMDENEHAEMLVALARVRWEQEKQKLVKFYCQDCNLRFNVIPTYGTKCPNCHKPAQKVMDDPNPKKES